MENNKELIISEGRSRKETNWKPVKIFWSEFVERLKTPMRSTETLPEYKSMQKSVQDDLKDVGGFVGGTLKGCRRKSGNAAERYLVTLDLDNIPAGQTDDILRRVGGLGCAYVIYSTRKHEKASPRLRIVIPSDRPMTPDEYQPVSRKVAAMIGIGFCDPTTFDVLRLMYWPSVCNQAEYVYTFGDKPFLNVDGILGMYGDWRNAAEWPKVLGEDNIINRSLKRQQNPTEKDGVIGAFCRVYDVPAAITEFIPDTYTETDIPGRYTFTGGSTAGGAVLYDNGLFLYSHHATDPAGGKLLNAFDLVRIHKFGHLDDDAKPDTPTPKLQSSIAMREFALQDEAVRAEHIASCFGSEEKAKEPYPDIKMSGNGVITILPTARNLETLLKNEGLKISYSLVRRKLIVKCEDKEKEYKFNNGPNSYGNLLTYCTDQFVRDGLRTSTAKVHEWITQIADDNRVNEARDFLEINRMIYGGTKGIEDLFGCLKVNGNADLCKTLLRKWICQCVAMAHNEKGEFGADGVLVLRGPHGIGKTSFFRKCCSIGLDYFIEGASLDGSKDKLMESTTAWIGELGELPRSMKDMDYVKAFITSANDKFRVPYAKKAEIYPRLTSFGATTNSNEFLKEDKERRFWVIDVEDIDLVALNGVCFESVWAEAMDLYMLLGQKSFRLSNEEREALRGENKQYRIVSEEEVYLREKLDWNQPRDQWKELTSTAICSRIAPGRNMSPVKVGRALSDIGYSKDSKEYPKRIKDGVSLYLVPSHIKSDYDFTTSE